MLRKVLMAGAGAVTVAIFAAAIAAPASAQQAGAAAACEGQAGQGAGNLQAGQAQQSASPGFVGGVRVAAGDVDGASQTGDLRARRGSAQSKEGGKEEMHLESWSWGATNPSNSSRCAPAARASEERPVRPR